MNLLVGVCAEITAFPYVTYISPTLNARTAVYNIILADSAGID